MSRRLIVIAQSVDENDDHRGFFIGWLREFSKNFDEVSVIALATGPYTLPPNVRVYSLGKERGAWKIVQAFRFYHYLLRLLPGARGIFAHASPIFVIASWPLAWVFRKKIILWYLHRSVTFKFRLAAILSKRVATADVRSLGIRRNNIVAVGHGIDADFFASSRDWTAVSHRPLRIVSAGRLSPIKDFGTMIRALALLRQHGRQAELRIIGQANLPEHHAYEQQLRALVRQENLEDGVTFSGSVPYRDMPSQYQWADVAVGATPHGGIDKFILEAMAAGCIALTSNDVMREYLEPYADRLMFAHGNAQALADRLNTLSEYPAVSTAMVRNVREHHDLSTAIARISNLL
jgi:glycosyltransferase involved in cell wall biosynthesis